MGNDEKTSSSYLAKSKQSISRIFDRKNMLFTSLVTFITVAALTATGTPGIGVIVGIVASLIIGNLLVKKFDLGNKIADAGSKFTGWVADKVGLGEVKEKLSEFSETHSAIPKGISYGIYAGLVVGCVVGTMSVMGLGSGIGMAAIPAIAAVVFAVIGLVVGALQSKPSTDLNATEPSRVSQEGKSKIA